MNMQPLGHPASGGENLPAVPEAGTALAPAGSFNHVSYAGSTNDELNLATLWRVIWEWRWLILSMFATGIAGAIILTLLSTPLYRSSAVIELNPPKVEVISETKGNGGMRNSDQQFIGTQLGLLQSRALAQRVAQDLNLAANPELVPAGTDRATGQDISTNIVAGSLRVDLAPNSRLVALTAVSADPELAARIVNGAADAYINSTLERRYQASSFARDFLQRQIASVRRELENSERSLVEYAQRQRLISTGSAEKSGGDDGGSLAADSLVAMNNAYAEAQTKRFAAEQKYKESLGGGQTLDVNERTAPLRAQVAALTAEYNQKLSTFKPDYPDMIRLKAQINSLNGSIGREASATRTSRSNTYREEYLAARTEESKLRARVSELSGQVLDLRGRNIRYNILKRDVDTNRALYDALLQRYKEIGVAGGIGDASASIVDRGQAAKRPYKPSLAFNLLVGAVLGLIAGFGVALVLEFINDTIKSPDDVRDKLRLPFLGGIPTARGTPVEELADIHSGVSEAYFSLASAIRYISETGVPRTILLTSTRPAEGKSTSAWGIAQNLIKLGKSVLLIDADMRRPAFVTGAANELGLSSLLTSSASVVDMTMKTEVPQLSILPSGPIPPSPPELLASPRFLQVLEEAQQHFDVVVIDGPPILGLADAPILAASVSATVMVVESGRTRTRAAIEAHNRLRAANAHIVGAILTRYRAQAAYGYGYGYGQESYTYKVDDKRRRRIALNVQRDG